MHKSILLLLVFSLWLITACEPKNSIRLDGQTMGTRWSVSLVKTHLNEKQLDALWYEITVRLEQLDNIFSNWKDSSEISQFNRLQTTDWFEISDELYQVILVSKAVHQETDGAFDITLAPLIERWGFGKTEIKAEPTADELEHLKSRVGMHLIELHEHNRALRKLNPLTQINLSAIAKGYAVDQIIALIKAKDIQTALVEIGGEVRTISGKDKQWKIAIARPEPGKPKAEKILKLTNAAVATSGGYQNFITLEQQSFIHILDPHTARPVKTTIASVSVIHPKATILADAYATAFMLLPTDKILQIAKDYQLEVIIYQKTNKGFREISNTKS